jgi:hypothetical protein
MRASFHLGVCVGAKREEAAREAEERDTVAVTPLRTATQQERPRDGTTRHRPKVAHQQRAADG